MNKYHAYLLFALVIILMFITLITLRYGLAYMLPIYFLLCLSSLIDIKTGYVYTIINIIILICIIINHVFNKHPLNLNHAILIYVFLYIIYKNTNGKFGYGDIETIFTLSLSSGILKMIEVIAIANIMALTYIIIYYLLTSKIKKALPFIPFISIAYFIVSLNK